MKTEEKNNEQKVNQKLLNLKEVRKLLNMTQDEFAQYVGIDRSKLSKFENGHEFPEWLNKAIRLNKVFKQVGHSLDDLIIPSNEEN